MKNNELYELLKYINPRTILIVNQHKKLIELHCPFKIYIKQDVGELKKGDYAFVDLVKVTPDIITVFIIDGKGYYFYHFDILID